VLKHSERSESVERMSFRTALRRAHALACEGPLARLVVLSILRTHVHLLVRTAPRIDLPQLVQFLKGGSSYAASRLPGNIMGLRWSREYSATTVSPKQLAGAIRYIKEQASHHPGEGVEEGEPKGKVGRTSH